MGSPTTYPDVATAAHGRCQECGTALRLHWRHCMSCGCEIEWPHMPNELEMQPALCTCGAWRCPFLIARLSERLNYQLRLTPAEMENIA